MAFLHALLLLLCAYPSLIISSIVFPLYIAPDSTVQPHPWTPLYDAVNKTPHVDFTIIINPDSGPTLGDLSSTQLADYLPAVQRLKTFPNVKVLGYVNSYSGATASKPDLIANITRWAGWAKNDPPIHLDGIFIDQTPVAYSTPFIPLYTDLQAAVTLARSNALPTVFFGPGKPVDTRYFDLADNIVWYSGSFNSFNLTTFKALDEQTRHNTSAFITASGTDVPLQSHLLVTLIFAYIETFAITTASDFGSFSSLWVDYVRQVNQILHAG